MLMSEIEIITDGGRRRRWSAAEKLRIVEEMPRIKTLVAKRPSYGYRRITAVLNRALRAEGLAPVNHKRIYRIMRHNNLLLARKYTERPEHIHDGKVIVMRSNLRSPLSLGPMARHGSLQRWL